MYPKLGIYPEYWVKISDGYAKGKRYLGQLSEGYCRPHGYGILELKKNTYYVGELSNGQASGRGFVLTYKQWTEKETYTVRGTYEEVMATAEFDSCGRVIHCDPVYHTRETEKTMEDWHISDDGLWAQGKLQRALPPTILQSEAWAEAEVGYMVMDIYDHCESHWRRYYHRPLRERKENGSLMLENECHVVAYDNLSLLVVQSSEIPFRLEAGQDVVLFDGGAEGRGMAKIFSFTLGKDYRKYIDLQLQEWKSGRMRRPLSMASERLYCRALASLIFCCDSHERLQPSAYAEAIRQRLPEAAITAQQDGTQLISLPDDQWTISNQRDHVWLYSARAKDRIRLSCRQAEQVAEVAEQAAAVWHYIEEKNR